MKKYVYTYIINNNKYYWYNTNQSGDVLTSDSSRAKVVSEKEINILDLDNSFNVGDSIYVEDMNDYITLESSLTKVRIY